MKDVLLILFGALISCGTTAFLDWIRFERDENIYNKRKKEEAYVAMLDFMTEFFAKSHTIRQTNSVSNELRIKINGLKTKGYLYLNKKFVDEYYQVIIDMTEKEVEADKMDNLYSYARKDLGIEKNWR